jgi:hypothetical protein
MLYRVAGQLRTILFIPDPFRRLLRTSVRNARSCSFSNSSQRVQVIRRTMTTQRLDGMAFELA